MAALFRWLEFPVKPAAERFGFHRVRVDLGLVDSAALGAPQSPMFEALAPWNDPLNSHAGLTLRAERNAGGQFGKRRLRTGHGNTVNRLSRQNPAKSKGASLPGRRYRPN